MLAANTVSTATYRVTYVQPRQVAPSPATVKEQKVVEKYVPVKKVRGYGTGYFGPRREDYSSRKEYLKAVRMNGEGKETWSGTAPRIGTLAADISFYPIGTIIFIPEINFWGRVEDIGPMVKGKKHIDFFCGHGRKAERIANLWGAGTPITFYVMQKKSIRV